MALKEYKQFKKTLSYQTQSYEIINEDKLENDQTYFLDKLPFLYQCLIKYKLNHKQTQQTESSTIELDPQFFQDKEFKNNIIQENEYNISYYIKNPNILINHRIYQGSKVQVYQCLNAKNNTFYVIKQLYNKDEYQLKKEMYIKLEKDKQLWENYLFIKDFQYEDDYNLLIIQKAECDLRDFMEIKYNLFQKERQDKSQFHLSNKEFSQLALFLVQAVIQFEKLGVYLQDNKPENVLIKKEMIEGQLIFKPVFTDFGSVYVKKSDGFINYPNQGTQFYYDHDQYEQKQQKSETYRYIDVVQNEIYCIARFLQVCLFPCNYGKNKLLEACNLVEFSNKISSQYDYKLGNIFKKMIDTDRSLRYNKYQQLEIELADYLSIQSISTMKIKWKGFDQNIKGYRNGILEKFYQEYFGNIIKQKEINFDQLMDILKFLKKNSLNSQAHVLIDLFKQNRLITIKQQSKLYFELGSIFDNIGQFDKAKIVYEKCLNLQVNHYGEGHIKTASAMNNLGGIYKNLGQLEKAKDLSEKCLNLEVNNYGKGHIQTADTINNLGAIFKDLGQIEKAKDLYEKSLNLRVNHYGEGHINTAVTMCNLGGIFEDLGQLEKAKDLYEKSMNLQVNHYGEGHINTTTAMSNLGGIFKDLGQLEKAKDLYEKCLNLEVIHYGEGHINTADTMNNLGVVFQGLGQLEKAKDLYEKCLNLEVIHYGEGHINTAVTLNNLGLVLYKMGKETDGKQLIDQAYKIEQQKK